MYAFGYNFLLLKEVLAALQVHDIKSIKNKTKQKRKRKGKTKTKQNKNQTKTKNRNQNQSQNQNPTTQQHNKITKPTSSFFSSTFRPIALKMSKSLPIKSVIRFDM